MCIKYCWTSDSSIDPDQKPRFAASDQGLHNVCSGFVAFRDYAYPNILQKLTPKTENFQMKNANIFLISAQNMDCGYSLEPPRRGGSNEYPQFMFLSRNKKICIPL